MKTVQDLIEAMRSGCRETTSWPDMEPLVREAMLYRESIAHATIEHAEKEIAALKQALDSARQQLPENMQGCKILFKECGVGHGWLTAANWVERGCPTCELQTVQRQLAVASQANQQLREEARKPYEAPKLTDFGQFKFVAVSPDVFAALEALMGEGQKAKEGDPEDNEPRCETCGHWMCNHSSTRCLITGCQCNIHHQKAQEAPVSAPRSLREVKGRGVCGRFHLDAFGSFQIEAG